MRKPVGKIKDQKVATRTRRRLNIRSKISGTSDRPRVCVSKTNKHLRVQVIDDNAMVTIVSAQTYGKNAVSGAKKGVEGGKTLGKFVADKMKEKNISSAVFDRSGYKYFGIIANIAEGIRENGINL
jgi:large subunit ribosomal protein L18